ncbi:hypothetical protein KB553_20510 [Chryseobacterium rhizoplanae]|uniref:hypothetical protein n=1 Tax=Chryseobacterium rhizoplanae TaxID=1609531 RepID=UPI001CE2ED78|nr:hypothetical protein [Chryseobacterium rhizoplanae]UCA59373.1 hypothetical protein KB553_20510 [Chryseobacterium rhizoplanae]
MKIIKRIIFTVLILIIITGTVGYVYFEHKFTPEKNYLTIENESGAVPIIWAGKDKNALLVPILFPKDTAIYYLQFDTGAVYTELYSKAAAQLREVTLKNDRAAATFFIGKTKITSGKIKISNTGTSEKNTPVKIIGTLGADILEDRRTLINFREHHIVFNLSKEPDEFKDNLIDFKFKKRKIIIQGSLNGKNEKFLYDSGTSAYELLTSKENWENLRLPTSKVKIEKAQSRPALLTAYTAKMHDTIRFKNKNLPLNAVTYVEGFSKSQYMLMKFSGMSGMLGNRIFLDHNIYIDCSKGKIGIE